MKKFTFFTNAFLGLACASMLISCSTVTPGKGGTIISGSAGGATSAGANSGLERCSETLGTLAIDDGREESWMRLFRAETNVTTVEPLLRLAVQQSNCFIITSVGNQRMEERIQRITKLQRESGEFRAGSKQHKGQRVAADYYLEPRVIINNSPVGGVTGTLGAVADDMFNTHVLGSLGGSIDIKSSVVSLSLFDIRSGVQISASEGSATSNNYGAALGFFGNKASGVLSGYSSTPAGKATVAAFLDGYNEMVRALRSYKAQSVRGGSGTGGLLKVN